MAKTRQSVVNTGLVAAIDFDDTLVSRNGQEMFPGAREALTYLKRGGWKIIVWTHNDDLDHVERTLKKFKIPYDEIKKKIYFTVMVDNKAIGFNGNWANIVNEMENRRGGKMKLGKVSVMSTKDETPIAIFSIRDGSVVEETGTTNKAISAMMSEGIESETGETIFPGDGEVFLKALSQLSGTYLWAEAY